MHKKLARELDRVRRLAKAYAVMEQETVGIYMEQDGSYSFSTPENITRPIIEYVTPY